MRRPDLDAPAGRVALKRLNDLSKATGTPLHGIATRYALERFLHRLFDADAPIMVDPASEVLVDRETVVLKGGLTMIFAEGVRPHQGRTTGDVDLHMPGFAGGLPGLAAVLSKGLARAPVVDDGVRFDAEAIEVVRDREERSGGSVSIPLQIGNLALRIRSDVSLDARPMHDRAPVVAYPSVLEGDGLPAAMVRRVPWEFMLADKIAAAVEAGMLNRRIRDFADMALVLETQEIDHDFLASTLSANMMFRGRLVPASIDMAPGFSDAFASAQATRWEQERRARRFRVEGSFPEVVTRVREALAPVFERAAGVDPVPAWASGPR